jgi:hypothetical protein
MANIAGRVYLPPASYDELANFLDHAPTPAVVGFRLSALPLPSEQLPELAQSPLAAFDIAARQTLHKSFTDGSRDIMLQSVAERPLAGWAWEGSLQYEDVYTLDGGNHIYRETCVRVLAREASTGDVDIAIITTQVGDREVADAWLNRMNKGRWLKQPVVMPMTEAERLAAVETILAEFGPRVAKLRSPDVYPGGRGERKGFLGVMRRAAYETGMTDLATIVERMREVDEGTLGALQVFLWERGRQAIIAVELRRRPTESYARLTWRTGKSYDASSLDLTDAIWESATPIDWSVDRKQEHLLSVWAEVLRGLDTARVSAVAAADAS